MWNIQIDNHVKREKKLEENINSVYQMIFKDLCPSQTKNRIKDHPKYDSINNNILKIMDGIDQSMHNTIQETYPYLLLAESLAIIMNNRQQQKEGLVEYMEMFKQENIILKCSIR